MIICKVVILVAAVGLLMAIRKARLKWLNVAEYDDEQPAGGCLWAIGIAGIICAKASGALASNGVKRTNGWRKVPGTQRKNKQPKISQGE